MNETNKEAIREFCGERGHVWTYCVCPISLPHLLCRWCGKTKVITPPDSQHVKITYQI